MAQSNRYYSLIVQPERSFSKLQNSTDGADTSSKTGDLLVAANYVDPCQRGWISRRPG